MANTDRGRKPIKRGAGRRMVDGKNFRLADEVRYILRRAAEHDGRVLGYCYAGLYRTRIGYRYSVEDSIYIDAAETGRGIGRALLAPPDLHRRDVDVRFAEQRAHAPDDARPIDVLRHQQVARRRR